MSQTITIQIPDDLAQDLASQAEQLNVSVENLVVRSLTTFQPTSFPSLQLARQAEDWFPKPLEKLNPPTPAAKADAPVYP